MLKALAPLGLVIVGLVAGCSADTSGNADDTGSVTSEALSGNAQTAFQFFVDKGLSDVQAAAIVGNLQQESGISPSSVQPGGPGRGIAQWSNGERWNVTHGDNLASYASEHGVSAHSLQAQLDFIWFELQNFSQYGLASLENATTVDTATRVFMRDFEACGACNATQRVHYAKQALTQYGGGN